MSTQEWRSAVKTVVGEVFEGLVWLACCVWVLGLLYRCTGGAS